MNKKGIFITGATSKIGKYLIAGLDYTKYDIYALSRHKDHIFNSPVKTVPGDLSEPESYLSVFKNCIHIVIHLGAVTHTNDVSKYYKINVEATSSLIKLCERNKVKKLVFISTRAISDKGGAYSRSKAQAEALVRASSLDWVIMRLAEVYGISDNEGVDLVLNSIKKMPVVPIIGNGEYGVAPVHVSDAVSAIIKVIENESIGKKLYNISGPENYTYNQFIDKILQLYKIRKFKIRIPRIVASIFLGIYAVAHKKDSPPVIDQLSRLFSDKSYDISEARRDLGFDPLSLEKIIG